jgi:lysozyme family protein
MSTERFEGSLVFVLKWEGSAFTNDPVDHGGATRFGIIQREYDAFRGRVGLPLQSVAAITMDEVRAIYRHEYWEAVDGDELPAPVDIAAFDTGVLMGVKRSSRFLQQSLGVTVDGSIGPQTLKALAQADALTVATKLLNLREARLHAIVAADPPQQRFLKGWLNRLNDLRRTALQSDHFEHVQAGAVEEIEPEEGLVMGRASLDLPEDFGEVGNGGGAGPAVSADSDGDPGAPAPGEVQEDFAAASELANFGPRGQAEELPSPAAAEEGGIELESAAAPTLPVDIAPAQTFLDDCMTSVPRVGYHLSSKVPFHGAVPGKDFQAVDCSGFVREAIWRATSPHLAFPDGSVVQHDWIRARGFERSTPDAAFQEDGAVRIAFLRPQESPTRVGHVVLIQNARTLESHGGVGPDSRPWTKTGWQEKAFVYLLTRPAF